MAAAAPCLVLGLGTIRVALSPALRRPFDQTSSSSAIEQLRQLVNIERVAEGLEPLALDDLAGKVCDQHAQDMITGGFLSHWGRDGLKPYQRYSFAGGIDAVEENVSEAESIGSVAPEAVIQDLIAMHIKMHAEIAPNDGHRRAMLNPQHTHVGFGVARQGHSLRLAELFVSRYVDLEPADRHAKLKGTLVLRGRLLNPQHILQQVEVFHEPLPKPPAIEWLRTPRSYGLPDLYVTLRPVLAVRVHYEDGTIGTIDLGGKGKFRVPVKLFAEQPGIYTAVFWIRKAKSEKAIPVTEICIQSE
jgi:uncharacterized protein YkwD